MQVLLGTRGWQGLHPRKSPASRQAQLSKLLVQGPQVFPPRADFARTIPKGIVLANERALLGCPRVVPSMIIIKGDFPDTGQTLSQTAEDRNFPRQPLQRVPPEVSSSPRSSPALPRAPLEHLPQAEAFVVRKAKGMSIFCFTRAFSGRVSNTTPGQFNSTTTKEMK